MTTTQGTRRLPFFASLASVGLLGLVACSGANAPTGTSSGASGADDTNEKTSSSSSSSGSTSSSSSGSTTTTAAGVDPAQCKGKGDQACFDCCTADDVDATKAADDAFGSCVCGANGVCRTECATDICSDDPNAQPTQACETCLKQKAGGCKTAATSACDADPKCKAAVACLQAACDGN